MILNPAIIALLMGSFLISLMMLYSGFWGLKILRKWDLRSGSEMQLAFERRTYLISTILNYVFGFQLVSLFLFIYTAEDIHKFFVGAMCAAGTLNVNQYGYPLLIVKIVNFLLAGVWLVVNYADTRAYDYPLTRTKYGLLLFVVPSILIEAFLQSTYFLNLKADVITSCCGSLFSSANTGVASDIVSLPPLPVIIVYYLSFGCFLLVGVYFMFRGKGGYLFSLLSSALFLAGVAALISAFSIYIYELPTHHCPFCILQKEYGYIGYVLYITILITGITGASVGILMVFRNVGSLSSVIPSLQKRLALVSLASAALFALLAAYKMLTSNLTL